MNIKQSVWTRLAITLSATVSAAVAVSAADISFAIGRGSSVVSAYFLFCMGTSALAYASVAILAALLRRSAESALAWCVGLEAFMTTGPWSGAIFMAAVMLVLTTRARILNPAKSVHEAIRIGLVVGLALVTILILWQRVGYSRKFFGHADISFAITGASLLATLLLCSQIYARFRVQFAHLLGSSPKWLFSELIPWAVLFCALFVFLPLNFTIEPRSLPKISSSERKSNKPNILILVLDTVRADHFGSYGYDRPTTPMLDRFINQQKRTVVFPLAFAPSPWTIPSHASLFSGLPSTIHGVHYGHSLQAYNYGSLPKTPTIAESMKSAGYRTALIFANIYLRRIGDGTRGFEVAYLADHARVLLTSGEAFRYRFLSTFFADARQGKPQASKVNDGILRFLDECGVGPCFVVANYMEAHTPYYPREPYSSLFVSMPRRPDDSRPQQVIDDEDKYDAEIRGLDERIVQLLNSLENKGILANSWVFITSDHGEAFGEHGGHTSHGNDVYNEEARIPLIVIPPKDVTIPVVATAVDLLDVTATVSAIAGAPIVGKGRDLRNPIETNQSNWVELFTRGDPSQPAVRATVQGKTKLISRRNGTRELYRLDADPEELSNLASTENEIVQSLEVLVPSDDAVSFHQSTPVRRNTPSPEEAAKLRALGYIE